MPHLSDRTVAALKAPERGQRDYADEALPGFAVRVSQGGSKTFTLTFGSPRKRVTLGRYPIITLAQAREKARQLLAHRTLHGDRPPALMFEEALTLFLRVHCAEHNRPSTAMETERLLRRHALPPLGSRTLEEITTGDILRITDGMLGTPSEANHFFYGASHDAAMGDQALYPAQPDGRASAPRQSAKPVPRALSRGTAQRVRPR
jgi:Arm DNA-binding domain/Phage integrase, N-terminal SAM-like domain